ncbi:MAG: hypothetical protein Q9159_001782 [Coniocarpon cinnabarinum]
MPRATSDHDNLTGRMQRRLYDLPTTLPESYNVRRALGDIRGYCCLDLACGTGRWSRLMSTLGAREVHGVDSDRSALDMAHLWSQTPPQYALYPGLRYAIAPSSWQMTHDFENIELFDEEEMRLLDGDRYIVTKPEDFFAPDNSGFKDCYDVVVASNLSEVCSSIDLVTMLARIQQSLRSHGRVIAVLPLLDRYTTLGEQFPPQYGLKLSHKMELQEDGEVIGWRVTMNYHTRPLQSKRVNGLNPGIFEKCAKKAGLENSRWTRPAVPEDLRQGTAFAQPGYWEEWEKSPSFMIWSARKMDSGAADMGELKDLEGIARVRMRDENVSDVVQEDWDNGISIGAEPDTELVDEL